MPFPGTVEILGRSPQIAELREQIRVIAPTSAPVLLRGETGTGKSLVARVIHQLSRRSGGAFVAFSAANLQEQLFESELFGHVKGAFSGALADHHGLARAADGGTLFLDEIGELTAANQARLLHFLDNREVRPVGSTRSWEVDVRIVCATNRTLDDEVRQRRFRQDLFFRLNVVHLTVPPLRERPGDVVLLAEHFLATFCARHGKSHARLRPEAVALLTQHPWPGNVRELANEVERAVVLTPSGEPIGPDHLSPRLRGRTLAAGDAGADPLGRARRQAERRLILQVLGDTGWNVSAAARELGMSRVGLCKKLKRLGVARPASFDERSRPLSEQHGSGY
ncbi:MAG TPA: sigma-54 dependent transcriptional regulator [Thermoanaerobaculia bacterium]|nr:sigma-54 dependent transcriptional regulator [Thermoanaerobaculia bacterium]